MQSVAFIQWCLDNLNYWTITLLMAIESSFIPFPSEIVITPAAYKAAEGGLNIYLVVLFGTIGANIGSFVNYYLAYFIGRPLLYRFVNSKTGHLFLLSGEKLDHAEKYFAKHGSISIFIGRLIPAVRQLISIPAGLAKMRLAPFVIYTTLGAGIWNIILAAIGYYFQSQMPEKELMGYVLIYSEEFKIWILSILAICIILFVAHIIRKRRALKKNQAAE